MTKIRERRLVTRLRKQGKSYSEIRKIVPVSKSSLSLWLKDVPLRKSQIRRIAGLKEKAIERFRESMKIKKENRLHQYYEFQSKKWSNLTDRELLLAGIFLYWGEGNKFSNNLISINNTDPAVVKFSLFWILRILKFPKEKVKVQVHLYQDMDIKKEIKFWANELKIPLKQFSKPYIKKTNKTDIDQKGFGHGTCGVSVGNTVMKENILMSIKAIGDAYGQKLAQI